MLYRCNDFIAMVRLFFHCVIYHNNVESLICKYKYQNKLSILYAVQVVVNFIIFHFVIIIIMLSLY